MYSKVTLACALKGDDKSRLKQLFKCKYSGSSLFHFSTVKDSVFVFIDGSLFFSCLLSRQLDTGEEVQHIYSKRSPRADLGVLNSLNLQHM